MSNPIGTATKIVVEVIDKGDLRKNANQLVYTNADGVEEKISLVEIKENLTKISEGFTKTEFAKIMGVSNASVTLFFQRDDNLSIEDLWSEKKRISVGYDEMIRFVFTMNKGGNPVEIPEGFNKNGKNGKLIDYINRCLFLVGRPLVYDKTAYVDVNKRNYVIESCADFLDENLAQFGESKMFNTDLGSTVFLDYVLTELGLSGMVKKNQEVQDFNVPCVVEDFLEKLKKEIPNIGCVNVAVLRSEYCKNYREIHGEKYDNNRIRKEIFSRYHFTADKFFVTTAGAKSASRRAIIISGLFLECTIDNINHMLKQANYPLINPRTYDIDFFELFFLIKG